MKIRPLFKWFGSKWQSAGHYPEPLHKTIAAPYAGGEGYGLNYCDRNVLLWDADLLVKDLWVWLIQEATPDKIREIPVGLAIGTDIRTLGLSYGQQLLLKHWQRTNNVGDCWTVSPWGHMPGQWTENTRARVAEESQAIKHWRVSHFATWTEPEMTWFIDPPYQYNYRYRRDLPDFDYASLASLVRTLPPEAQVIVCEAVGKGGEIPKYLPFEYSHRSVTSRRKETQSHHSKELVYYRAPTEVPCSP